MDSSALMLQCTVAADYCRATLEIEARCSMGGGLECEPEGDAGSGCCEMWIALLPGNVDVGDECVVTLHFPNGSTTSKTVTVGDGAEQNCVFP
jgi:hypothetical protein